MSSARDPRPPPEEVADKLEKACELAIDFYPPSEAVLASCTIVGLPFSIYFERQGSTCTYFYQVALWLERKGRIYKASEPPGEDLACFYAPLILVRDECVARGTPATVAVGLIHEAEHLRRYPEYTRQVLELVRRGMGREEAIPIVREREEGVVGALMARLSAENEAFREACIDAEIVETLVRVGDELAGRLAPWGRLGYAITFYVFSHRQYFRVHECFCELRELLLLDAERKARAWRELPEEAREADERACEALERLGRELEVSWIFRWSPRGRG